MRVVSWNVAFCGPKAAKVQGDLLRKLKPDLMLLQEVNRTSSDVLANAAGADWIVSAADLQTRKPVDLSLRRRGVAIAGHGPCPRRKWLLDGIEQSEKILLIETQTEGTPFVAVTYHAPPGVSYGIVKPRQAVTFVRWLSKQKGPLLFGADANTPKVDAPDFANTRTHFHTGRLKLNGEDGDDLLFGPDKAHDLDDALRRWLSVHPDEMDKLRASKPFGPLAVTHRTGRRKNSPGTDRRFDSVWVSRHWVVRRIQHLYAEGCAAGSDHAPVVVDLDLSLTAREQSLQPQRAPGKPRLPSAFTSARARTSAKDTIMRDMTIPEHLARELTETVVTRQRAKKILGIESGWIRRFVRHARAMVPPHVVERHHKGAPFVVGFHLRAAEPGEQPGQLIDV